MTHAHIETVFTAVTEAFGFKSWKEWRIWGRRWGASDEVRQQAARIAAVEALVQDGCSLEDIAAVCCWPLRQVRQWHRYERFKTSFARQHVRLTQLLTTQKMAA